MTKKINKELLNKRAIGESRKCEFYLSLSFCLAFLGSGGLVFDRRGRALLRKIAMFCQFADPRLTENGLF
jgi:hypothetical protein